MTTSEPSRTLPSSTKGSPLIDLIGPPLPIARFLELGSQIASALSELHRGGMLHKNLNPRTIRHDAATGQVAITDFELASYLPREQPAAQSPSVFEGMLEYMSPEQTGRMSRSVDSRSDLYSLGVTFYELLTGKLPLTATDALGWVHAHVALTPPRPSEHVPAIPAQVADIVMRLLAKASEDRYESALGLQSDLDRCRDELARAGHIEPFPLGQHDTSGRLAVPQKLYGRDAELRLLLGAFERVVATSRPELVAVSGLAGIGKSSLVHELHKPLIRERGLFISGKFEQYSRGIPYSTLVLAFRDLTRQVLAESDEQLAAFRTRIESALGVNGRLITELIPEVKLILGEQPPVVELGPQEAQNRFMQVLQSFIRATARPDHPIVLFLDDLQWADTATLDLLPALAADPELRHIAFLLAYRNNEVDAAHPLTAALEKIQSAGAAFRTVHLDPLDLESTGTLVADTLRTTPEQALPLAQVVFQKTGGNPFFAGEFLKALEYEGLLAHDPATRSFRWDIDKIQARAMTDNVVDLLLERLKRLPPETLTALTLSACIGTTFRLELLAGVTGKAAADVARDLLPAMQEGIIASVGVAYPRVVPREPDAKKAVYRFEHDRIQQAAHSLLDEDRKRAAHLSIGRMLLAQTPEERIGETVFEIVNHLNSGMALVTDPAEKQKLSDLNAAAGRKARAATAYGPALEYFRTAKAHLREDAWESRYEETLSLHGDLAECAYVRGNFDEGEATVTLALAKVRDLLDEGKIHRLRLVCYELLGRFPESLAIGIAALHRFGVDIPTEPEAAAAAFGAELGAIAEALGSRSIAEVIDAPLMPDGIAKTAMGLLTFVHIPAFLVQPALFPVIAAKGVAIALKHGNGPGCAKAYGPYSVLQVAAFGDVDTAYQYSKLALQLCDKFNDARIRPSVLFSHGSMIILWREHYDTSVRYTEECFRTASELGDYTNANYAGWDLPLLRIARGDRLDTVVDATRRYEALAKLSGQAANVRILQTYRQVLQSLRGLTPRRDSLGDDSFDDAAVLQLMKASGNVLELAQSSLVRLVFASLYGRHEEALVWAESTRAVLAPHKTRVGEVLYVFHRSLALAGLHSTATPEVQQSHRKELEEHRVTFERWAAGCPANFRHQLLLLSAEIARIDGRSLEAMSLYEQAARAAAEQRFIHDEGLARELFAKLFFSLDQPVAALAQLVEACKCYEAWGANGKIAALEEAYPALKLANAKPLPAAGASVDQLTVVAASQAISGEIDQGRLLHRLMTITLQNAAAERGCLLRVRGDQLFILAEAGVEQGEVKTTLRNMASVGELSSVPLSILHYVRRSGTSVVLDHAAKDPRFAGDPRVTPSHPKSVLCLPLLRQAELIGILYLENNLTAGAFTKDHIALLELLASQAAISLENATLYTDLKQENIERKRAEEEVRTLNSELEHRVIERTADLAAANRELGAANRELEAFSYSVSHDLQAPTRTMDSYVEAVLEDYGASLDATARGYLERARATGRRLIELTDDMLHLAQVTRAEMKRDVVDMSGLAREVARTLDERAPGRTVAWSIADGVAVSADRKLVRILLENLLGNAFKFTSKGATSCIDLGVREDTPDEKVYFVRDNGSGFDMEKADRLFGVFQRLHKDTEFPGTGIGLATVQRIVNRHGGRVWAEGKVGEGATFYFTL